MQVQLQATELAHTWLVYHTPVNTHTRAHYTYKHKQTNTHTHTHTHTHTDIHNINRQDTTWFSTVQKEKV